MKTRVVDGVEYEELDWVDGFMADSNDLLILRPIPPKHKTIVQAAAEMQGVKETSIADYIGQFSRACFEAIEQRLQAIERKLERSDAGGKEVK